MDTPQGYKRLENGAMVHDTAKVGEWATVGEGATVGEWATVGEGATVVCSQPCALTPKGHVISQVSETEIAVGCQVRKITSLLKLEFVCEVGMRHEYTQLDCEITHSLITAIHQATLRLVDAKLIIWHTDKRDTNATATSNTQD